MPFSTDLYSTVLARTLRVSDVVGTAGDGSAAARQLDAVLLNLGFVASAELMERLSELHPTDVHVIGRRVLDGLTVLVGAHVKHNVYFRDFPNNVPDTVEFWMECLADALGNPQSVPGVAADLEKGFVNLLALPKYGTCQHSYEELVAARTPFVASQSDRITVLDLGGTLAEESHRLYLQLASSNIVGSADDLEQLQRLAKLHVVDVQPETIPVRENRAVINAVRLNAEQPLLVDTVVDVLRLATHISGGDVTLQTKPRFAKISRPQRRALLAALDGVISDNEAKLGDVLRLREEFKRLGERLHPHEYNYANASRVFAVARGDEAAMSLTMRIEQSFENNDTAEALRLLALSPGTLLRNVDRLLRSGVDEIALLDAVRTAAATASTTVILGLRQHLLGRGQDQTQRLFINKEGRAHIADNGHEALSDDLLNALAHTLDEALVSRLPEATRVVVDPDAAGIALPLSNKVRPNGFGILPRGSKTRVDDVIRFFVYWHEAQYRTDYDLSVLFLDENFNTVGQVSYTNLSAVGAAHSGDITSAPHGASEFIDIDLSKVDAHYIVPQINIYSGEGFDQAKEAFFGYMQISHPDRGMPYDARTVRMKSDLFGAGRVGLPLAFSRDADGWNAQWLHLTLKGYANFNAVETNKATSAGIARNLIARPYLNVAYLAHLYSLKGAVLSWDCANVDSSDENVFIGLESPQKFSGRVYTPSNLAELFG